MELGNFTVAEEFNSLGGNSVFAALSDLQKMQVLNAAVQRIENEYFNSGLDAYQQDSASIASVIDAETLDQHFIVTSVSLAGFKISFDHDFLDTNYSVQMRVYSASGQDVGWQSYTKAVDGLTVVPNADVATVDLTVGKARVSSAV